ncbi:MAG: CHAD domain-containing protein [Sphingomonadales bacterium]|nr:CHAD domain-containing protein [Sphingomonadales bacterium]MDE2567653.1 CHAD domain-containing protein [Sphingomonadales bacterium]
MTLEVELKLAIAQSAAMRVMRSAVFGGEIQTRHHASTYYDTPSQTLRSAGVSLRVRREDHALVQTIKVRNGAVAGLFRRNEWTTSLHGEDPAPDERTGVPQILERSGEELQPQFTVSLQREVLDLSLDDGSAVEVAIDTGITAGADRSERFGEIEFELRRGDPAALFELARKVDAIAPVRIGVLTKADRGWRLLAPVTTLVKGDLPHLDSAMSVRAAFEAVASACVAHYRLNEDILLRRHSGGAVHQARIALRRLRAALRAFAPILPGPEPVALDRRLRSLAIALGQVRDLDVMIGRCEAEALREQMTGARSEAWRHLRRRLGAKHTRGLLIDLAEWIECGGWRTDPAALSAREAPLGPFAAEALDRRLRKVRRHGRRLDRMDEEALHRLRKDAKKLRYTAEAFATLFAGKSRAHRREAFLAAMEGLQDDLGALNDLRVAEAWLERQGLADLPEARDWIASMHERRHLKRARKERHELLDIKPFWR